MFSVDESKPALNIYFGSDYGFCGSINFAVNKKIAEDTDGIQVLIGRKLRSTRKDGVIKLNREEFSFRYGELEALLHDGLRNNSFSAINVIYYQYNNISSIELTEKKIFPKLPPQQPCKVTGRRQPEKRLASSQCGGAQMD